MIPDETIERVREAADIVQIIGEHVNLRRTGSDFRGPCPFHQGTHRNFSVSPKKGIYYCFVCHEGGDVFTFLQKRLGMEWPQAVKYVAERVGIPIEEVQKRREGPDPRQPFWDINSLVADWFRQLLWDDEEGRAPRDYLALRRVSREVADRFGLGYAPAERGALREHLNSLGITDEQLLEVGLLVRREDADELRPRFRNRLIFPIQDALGNYVGFGGRLLGPGEPKYLNSAESPVFSKARLLYGLHMAKHVIRRDDRIMIVEGYFDVVRLVSAGFDWVVAPLGTALTEPQAASVRRYTRNAFLLYDSDRAGLKATFRAGDELLRHGVAVQVVTLPGGEDPDSFVDKFGAEKLNEQLGQAIDVFERKVQLLERGGWFADLRRKRRALDRLLPTIRATSDPLTRDLYLTRASEAAGVGKELLARELGDSAPSTRAGSTATAELAPMQLRAADRRRAERRRDGAPRLSPERSLVAALLHTRAMTESVGERVDAASFRDPALRQIYEALLAVGPEAPLTAVATRLEPGARATLEELQENPPGEGFDIQKEINGSVARILAVPIDERLAEIDEELRIASDAEQGVLIAEKQRLTQERAALGVRRYKIFGRAR